MAVTEGQQTYPFELDEDGDLSYPTVSERGEEDVRRGPDGYDGGTLGLHLGVLRRFAAMAPGAPPRSIRPDIDR